MQKPTGLKAPSKIGRPTGLPHPKSGTGLPTTSKAQSAIEKSARAAGLPIGVAEKYAADLARRYAAPELRPSPTPTDDYKIGDYVYVGGTKGGRIAYIGETQFAPGEWAGVVLDEPVGKNDGSVGGVRYFQCEMKRGVFSRIAKLSKQPVPGGIKSTPVESQAATPSGDSMAPPVTPMSRSVTETSKQLAANGTAPTPHIKPTAASTPKSSGLSKRGSMSGSQSNLRTSLSGSQSNLIVSENKYNLKVGDRVLVSGTKPGVLRYVGVTDFANGTWAGVELDDPMGKNDGSVAGKRYFDCKPLYGLFAPIHKVTRATGVMATPVRRSSVSKLGLGLALSRERSGSNDSISSISSTTSNTSRSARPKTMTGRPSSGTASQHVILQKALKEKEEHVDQLLRELDIERSELAKSAAQTEEAEAALMSVKSEHERYLTEAELTANNTHAKLEKLQQENRELVNQLEEERRKVEDLQFTVEEESICKVEIETQSEHDQEMMKSLQTEMETYRDKCAELEKQLSLAKAEYDGEKSKVSEVMDSTDYYLDRIEELTHKLTQAEKKIQAFEADKQEDGAKAEEVADLVKQKTDRIHELEEELAATTNHNKTAQTKLAELQEEYQEQESKIKKKQDAIDELMQKLATSDNSSSTQATENQQLKSQISDLQRQLQASEDRSKNLGEDKGKLEHQIEELMKNSGDSSEQLSMLAEQLRDRDRKLAELQEDLCGSTQKIGELTERVEREREGAELEVENMAAKHQQDLKVQQDNMQELQKELEKSNQKLTKVKEKSDQDLVDLQAKRDAELNDLRDQISRKDEEVKVKVQEVKSQKEIVQKLQTDQEELKFEKEKLEKSTKKLETEICTLSSERDTISSERDQLVSERDQLLSEKQNVLSQHGSSQEQLEKLQKEKDQAVQQLKQLEMEKSKTEAERQKLSAEKDLLAKSHAQTTTELTERDTKLQEITKQMEALSVTCETAKQQVSQKDLENQEKAATLARLQANLVESENHAKELNERLTAAEAERDAAKQNVQTLQTVKQEKEKLESQLASVTKVVEEMKERHRQMMQNIETETTALKNALETHTVLLNNKDADIEKLRKELKAVNGENATLKSQTSTLKALENDKKKHEQRIKQLEISLAESQENANIMANLDGSDSVVVKLKEEKEAVENQVQFLNSVIVDLQKKNDELKARLEAMEAGVVNGDDEVAMDISQTSRMIAPRMFCDICEVFDLHDTDDCPKQAMSESPPASQYHGSRHDQRPYCDICEVFGHWTADCDDEQTF